MEFADLCFHRCISVFSEVIITKYRKHSKEDHTALQLPDRKPEKIYFFS